MPGRVCPSRRRRCDCAGRRRRSPPRGRALDHAAVRQRLRIVRPPVRPRLEQQVRRDHRHDPRTTRRIGGLPVPEHLASGRRRHQSAGDRVRVRGQQRHRLHRRPGVRRSQPREDRQRGGRHDQLPPEPVRLFQPGAAEDGRAADDDSGNFALLDLIKGLQFINRNIANFGGNPATSP